MAAKKEKIVTIEILATPDVDLAEKVMFEAGIKGFNVGIKEITGNVCKVRTNPMPFSKAEEIKAQMEKAGYKPMVLL